jgi:hypothetical protein
MKGNSLTLENFFKSLGKATDGAPKDSPVLLMGEDGSLQEIQQIGMVMGVHEKSGERYPVLVIVPANGPTIEQMEEAQSGDVN